MNEILNIIIKLAGTALGLALMFLASAALNYLKERLSDKEQEKLETFISALVAAAEQMYKADTLDADKRLGYVQGMLIEAGYELSDAINALIESKVYEINLCNGVIKNENQ